MRKTPSGRSSKDDEGRKSPRNAGVKKSYKSSRSDKPYSPRKKYTPKSEGEGTEERGAGKKFGSRNPSSRSNKPFAPRKKYGAAPDREEGADRRSGKKFESKDNRGKFEKGDKPFKKFGGKGKPKYARKGPKAARDPFTEPIRLNRFIANAGICSRRDADKLISDGLVSINGEVVKELGTKVKPGDEVTYAGEKLRPERLVYLLMNKPKDVITTVSDPQGRRTVIDLIRNKIEARVYPVGRLDRDTTGLLMLTNDGELAKKLMHPSHEVRKIYRVTVDKMVDEKHLEQLTKGVKLEDGIVKADEAVYVNDPRQPKKEIGIELHSGKNRVVRRMMEALGYEVKALDRVVFAQLDKKNLPRGKFRALHPREVAQLKAIK